MAFERFMCVAAGAEHSLAVTLHSTVFVWGSGLRGQLGPASGKQVPFLCPGVSIYALCTSVYALCMSIYAL